MANTQSKIVRVVLDADTSFWYDVSITNLTENQEVKLIEDTKELLKLERGVFENE